ncbi:MAG: hypothetical protein ABIL27_01390 [candidate division WOR-3 bacterium]
MKGIALILMAMPLMAYADPGKHLMRIFKKAETVAEGNQREEISKLKVKAAEDVFKLQAEIKALHVKLHELMRSPKASDEEIRKTHEQIVNVKEKLYRTTFSYILQLRKILGPEKFSEILRDAHHRGKGMGG